MAAPKGHKYSVGNTGGRPPIFKNETELRKAVDEYFDYIKEEKEPATVTGLTLFLGFANRQSLYDYEENNEKYSCIIKRARARVEHEYEKCLFAQSPTGAIFALKNMGWRDKSEIAHEGDMAVTWTENKTYKKDK